MSRRAGIACSAFIALLLATLAAPAMAAAAQRLEDVPDLRSAAFIHGRCERLMIAGEDVSELCRGPLYNARYHSGRISFLFPGGEDSDDTALMVSFSGTEQQREGGRIMLLVDRITLSGNAEEGAATEAAEGICDYDDVDSGPVRISCAARSRTGDFAGIFVTDGSPPRSQGSDGEKSSSSE